jgi:hypothetical protein
MAINTNPLLPFEQDLSPELLQQLYALTNGWQPGQEAPGGYEGESGYQAGKPIWSMPGQFGPTIEWKPNQVQVGTGDSTNWIDDPSGAGGWTISQPRNVSTWGGNDVAGAWDAQGKWQGWNSGATDARGLARLAAASAGAYFGGQALAGAGASAGAAATGGMSASEQIAFLAANGMSDAQIIAAYPELAAAGGLTGVTGGAAAAAGVGLGDAAKAAGSAGTTTGTGSTGSSLFQVGGTPVTASDLAKLGSAAVGVAGAAGAVSSASQSTDTSKYDQLFQNLLTEQQKISGRGDDQWGNYLSTFRPIEQKMAASALNYDTPQRREMAAQQAMGQVASSFDQQRQQANEEAIRYGMDPTTITAMGNANRLEEAKAQAGAANTARTNVENKGLELVSNAANYGRNLVNSSTQQSSVATGTAGTAAGIANSQAQIAAQNQANKTSMYSDLLNAGLTAYGMFSSSRKTKHVGKRVEGLAAIKAIEKSPANHWRYREGEGDGNTKDRMGPMAEDLAKVAPQVSDGRTVDGLALIGLQHAAIGNLSKRVKQLEKEVA